MGMWVLFLFGLVWSISWLLVVDAAAVMDTVGVAIVELDGGDFAIACIEFLKIPQFFLHLSNLLMRNRSLHITPPSWPPTRLIIIPHILFPKLVSIIEINGITNTIIVGIGISISKLVHLRIDGKLIIMTVYSSLFALPAWRLSVLREEA